MEKLQKLYDRKRELDLIMDGIEANLRKYLKHKIKSDTSFCFMSRECIEFIIEHYDAVMEYFTIGRLIKDAEDNREGHEKYRRLSEKLMRIKESGENSERSQNENGE